MDLDRVAFNIGGACRRQNTYRRNSEDQRMGCEYDSLLRTEVEPQQIERVTLAREVAFEFGEVLRGCSLRAMRCLKVIL